MSDENFPGAASRFASVGFSEIVQVRNRVLALLAQGHRVWRFEGGEPYMPTPDPIKAAMSRALARNETRYAPSSGVPELRKAILAKVRSRNAIPADDESPIVVNGGMHGLFAAFATLLDPQDEVLMLSPYWTPIVDVIRYHGAAPVLVPAEEAGGDGLTAALGKRLSKKTKLLYWNSPTNPTGQVFDRAQVEEVSAFVRENGLGLISDEAYEDLIYEGEGHVSPASFPGLSERTISVFTLSKTYSMTGWRAGYVLVPKRWRAAMQTAVLYSINGVSTPTQWAMLEALSMPPDFLEEAKAGYRRRRDALVAGLRGAGFELETPRAALYLFPKIPPALGGDSAAAATALLDARRIATVPGIVFGPEGEGHLRFSFSVAEETIEGGVAALGAAAPARA
ncbi:MAG: aminotransferase class I/II-fold pyridoxal phosphate-dependent enzyme [Acidobacteria bacterium]|nr:aminotransferase class I/II-fold pyridoxal phosphate-dependent enzyme [Acidobacteriota bacterium]MCA1610274.1 aminotransferase class I/II-fold pyridoxal phosphate-dependent enzyme [Acidobacteriota bacterium]